MGTLSEHESRALLRAYGIPGPREAVVGDAAAAVSAARRIGYPVVVKLSGRGIAHKSERRLVRLALDTDAAVSAAAHDLLAHASPADGDVVLLVAEMVQGTRELIAGLVRDAQFGPCVLLGLGGIAAEALADTVFRVAPVTPTDVDAMLDGLASHALFGEFRGEPPIDRAGLADVLIGLGRLGLERPDVASVDINPLLIDGARPVAVDALVDLAEAPPPPRTPPAVEGGFDALFEPRGVIVAGVSTHPGKFGTMALHNLLRAGYRGAVFAVSSSGEPVLGRLTLTSLHDVPHGAADLLVACTPAAANPALLREAAARGVRAAFVVAGGYAEVGAAALEEELATSAAAAGLRLAGPNGQGLISTPASLCAMIVPPYPPPGGISVASQSGNIMSSLLNQGAFAGVGFARAVSVGNAAQTGVGDYLEYFAEDPSTTVAVAYVEGVHDGRRFLEQARRVTAKKPLVILQGGVSTRGAAAAATHTASLASPAGVFAGACAQAGATRVADLDEAFDAAAFFATQPLPRGRRLAVVTQAGGWGVLASDSAAAEGLVLAPLPADLHDELDAFLPAGWSGGNPIDLAGRETRDTIPAVLLAAAAHPDVDAVLYLGLGIQAAQAHLLETGGLYPKYGLDRLAEFHRRQDASYGAAAVRAVVTTGKPVLVATELAYAGRSYENPGPAAVREAGHYVFHSAHRAVRALGHAVRYAAFRGFGGSASRAATGGAFSASDPPVR